MREFALSRWWLHQLPALGCSAARAAPYPGRRAHASCSAPNLHTPPRLLRCHTALPLSRPPPPLAGVPAASHSTSQPARRACCAATLTNPPPPCPRIPLAGVLTASRSTSSLQPAPRLVVERRWRLGLSSRAHPSSIMQVSARSRRSAHSAAWRGGHRAVRCRERSAVQGGCFSGGQVCGRGVEGPVRRCAVLKIAPIQGWV